MQDNTQIQSTDSQVRVIHEGGSNAIFLGDMRLIRENREDRQWFRIRVATKLSLKRVRLESKPMKQILGLRLSSWHGTTALTKQKDDLSLEGCFRRVL